MAYKKIWNNFKSIFNSGNSLIFRCIIFILTIPINLFIYIFMMLSLTAFKLIYIGYYEVKSSISTETGITKAALYLVFAPLIIFRYSFGGILLAVFSSLCFVSQLYTYLLSFGNSQFYLPYVEENI